MEMLPGKHDDVIELPWEQHTTITKSKLSRRTVVKATPRRHYSDVTGMMSSLNYHDNTSQSPWQHRGPTKLYPWQPPNTIPWQHTNKMDDIFTDYHRSNGHSSPLKEDYHELESDYSGLRTDKVGVNFNHVGLSSDHVGFKTDHTGLDLSKRWCYLYWSDLEGIK